MKKQLAFLRVIAISIIGIVIATGCATVRLYEGEARPKGEVSILQKLDGCIKVHAIDGIADSRLSSATIELLPGDHRMTVSYYGESPRTLAAPFPAPPVYAWYEFASESNVVLEFRTEAGRRYTLSSAVDFSTLRWTPLVADKAGSAIVVTGETVRLRRETRQGGTVYSDIEYMNRMNQTFGPRK